MTCSFGGWRGPLGGSGGAGGLGNVSPTRSATLSLTPASAESTVWAIDGVHDRAARMPDHTGDIERLLTTCPRQTNEGAAQRVHVAIADLGALQQGHPNPFAHVRLVEWETPCHPFVGRKALGPLPLAVRRWCNGRCA